MKYPMDLYMLVKSHNGLWAGENHAGHFITRWDEVEDLDNFTDAAEDNGIVFVDHDRDYVNGILTFWFKIPRPEEL
jgi:hypothetical protein